MSRLIPLTQGQYAIVDDGAFDWLNQWNWHCTGDKYAARGVSSGSKQSAGNIGMHRVVAGAAPGEIVDHINRDPLDNRRENLRVCSQRDNARNRRGWLTGKSQYKGVSYDRERCVWAAAITVNRRAVFIGRFEDESAAARAYDAAAQHAFEAFSQCNFPAIFEELQPGLRVRLDRASRGESDAKRILGPEARADVLARALRGEDHRWIAQDHGISRSAVGGVVFRHRQRLAAEAERQAA